MSGKGQAEIRMENFVDRQFLNNGETNVLNPLLVRPGNGEEVDGARYDRIGDSSYCQRNFGPGTIALCTHVNTINISSYMKLDALPDICKAENNIENGHPEDEHGSSFGKKHYQL